MKKEHWIYHWVGLLLLGVAALLTACSDDADTTAEETDVLQLVAYTRGMTNLESLSTRGIPDGYTAYYGPSSIGVFTTSADEAPASVRTFSYAEDQWKSLVSVKNHDIYYIYGYMPASPEINCTISKREGENMDYSQGAVLTFTNLPPVLAEDFSVVTGVQQLDMRESAVNLVPGLFEFEGRQTGSNFACLMLDHLYSCVRFQFFVDKTYNQLRTIKLKQVRMKTTEDIYYPLVVTMKKEEDYDVTWGTQGELTNDFATLFTSTAGEILHVKPEDSQEPEPVLVEGYFAPKDNVAGSLVLECTYDVYDKQGNMTRENCVAINKLPALGAGANQRTLLTLTVKPTYLYVLSEPDLDNPTITN
jgi:hypothetical protein